MCGTGGDGAIRFTSAILPRYLRRAKSLEDLLPWLYLKGISSGDFGEALAALLGSSAPGLSASTITRLKEVWGVEAERWQRRDLTAKRYVYFWVDGIYFSARCQRRSKSTPLAGVKMHHLMRFSPALAVVPVVHRRDPRCFV